ncbi:hypothetical protein EC973_002017 [Apophysomyces ossiformis]|uniref:Senescence domain-containing protein n=1 Tax=Apophysomyces ossiformis TaxID=679940 RepID=A0A8H7BIW8_9FUNG|nr:hypothetical protein EC973_002017 [Apophysomyces ossiformis]
MAIVPYTPPADSFDPKDLSIICAVDAVALMSYVEQNLASYGIGNVVVYLAAESQAIVLRFQDYTIPLSIVLVPQSKAWITDEQVLVLPRLEGGLWRIDCSTSDPAAFTLLQDVLTYFIQLENRHHMRNVIAKVDPVSCHVTEIVAKDVRMDVEDQELDSADDFMATECESGRKLPVILDDSDPSRARRVKLMYKSGDSMVAGSGRVAQVLVEAGHILAKTIQHGSKSLEEKLEPANNPLQLTDKERKVLETIHDTTSTVSKVATGFFDKLLSTTAAGIQSVCQPSTSTDPLRNATYHLGASVVQAAANVIGGVVTASTAVLASSRDGMVDIVHKKYGSDAGFAVKKTLGSTGHVLDTLVYFDGRGISRHVLVRGAHEFAAAHRAAAGTTSRRETMFVSPELTDEMKSVSKT